MVHSSYFIGGYAIHGYVDVPPYAASHGCLRVPIPSAWSIYAWVRMGDTSCTCTRSIGMAAPTLIAELRRHALIIGEVTLTSGRTAHTTSTPSARSCGPPASRALSALVASYAKEWEATAVGGLTMGADAPACAALAGGADVKAFFVRKETKQHGLQRRVEGPPLEQGERCLIVEDVVTTGGSTVQAIEAVRPRGHGLRRGLDPRPPGRGRRGDRARRRRRALRAAGDDRRRLPGPAGPGLAFRPRGDRLIDRVGREHGLDDHHGGAEDAGAVVEGRAGDADRLRVASAVERR